MGFSRFTDDDSVDCKCGHYRMAGENYIVCKDMNFCNTDCLENYMLDHQEEFPEITNWDSDILDDVEFETEHINDAADNEFNYWEQNRE